MDNRVLLALAGIALAYVWFGRSERSAPDVRETVPVQHGDPSVLGGSPAIRSPYVRQEDNPATSNDESNDQPRGHFGTLTLSVCNLQSGNCYPLDGDVTGTTLNRLYFPKGGWIDFIGCELDDDFTGECDDEEGHAWQINGE
jgi:hypothetical protein